MRARIGTLLLAAGLAVAALVAMSGSVFGAAAKADFSITAAPTASSVSAGSSTNYSITVTGSNGFKSPVTLSASGLPAGATATFSPNPNTLTTSTLVVATSAATPTGSYPLTVTGVSGSLAHSTSVTMTVTVASRGFTLTANPTSQNAPAGTVATYQLTVNRVNFPDAITFTATGAPPNAGVTFVPPSTTGNTTTLQVSTAANTSLGSYTITVKGTAGSVSSTIALQLTVSAAQGGIPFTISGSADRALAPGVTGNLDLSITNSNSVTLNVSNLTVSITGTSSSACATSNYAVTQFAGSYPLAVPKNAQRSLTQLGVSSAALPKITMINLPSDQNACRNVTVSLAYSGTGSGG